MEQIFESKSFELKVDETCKEVTLRVKEQENFKDEAEFLELLQKVGVRQEDLLSCKGSTLEGELPLAKKPIVPEQAVNYQMEKSGDYIKKDALLASVVADRQKLNCFGDQEYYVEKYVSENFLGDNTYFQNGCIYSDKDGCPYQDEKHRLNVRDKFTINEDLQQEVEEPFYGDLEVFGNILNTKIEVIGKLVVHGSISASQVKVHDILVVHNNVMEYSRVEVFKDASMAAASNSTIVCGGNIFFNTGITACKLVCEKSVVSDSSFSVIKSGEVELGDSLICANVGNNVQLPLSLSIGVLPYSKYRLEELNKIHYADTDKGQEILEKIKRLNQKVQDGIYASYDARQVEKKYLRITGSLHIGVEVAIYNQRETVQAEEKSVELSIGKGCIIKRSF